MFFEFLVNCRINVILMFYFIIKFFLQRFFEIDSFCFQFGCNFLILVGFDFFEIEIFYFDNEELDFDF